MEITSRENQTFKDLIKLKQKKGRAQSGLCIIEGEKIVREHFEIAERVFIRASVCSKINIKDNEKCDESNGKIIVLADKLFDLVTDLETDPGVLAVVKISKPHKVTFPYLVLDEIQDSGNMGTILRTAAAFGFETVICIDCVDVWSGKVLRASAGVQFALNMIECDFVDFLKYHENDLKGSFLIAADLDGCSVDKMQKLIEKQAGSFGLVLGNEGNGIRNEMKKLCTNTVTIPMRKGCESLNVAVAGGILIYEFTSKQT